MPQGVKSGTAYMLAGFGLGTVAHFFAQVVAGRHLGPEIYGLYGLVIYNAALVTGLFDSGIAVAMTTYIAESETQANKVKIRQILQAGLAIEIMMATLLWGVCLFFINGLADTFFQGSIALVMFFLGIVTAQGFFSLWNGALSGFRELKNKALVRLVQQIFLLTGMVVFIGGLSKGVNMALTVHLFSLGVALVLSFTFIWTIITSRADAIDAIRVTVEPETVRLVLRTAAPVSASFVSFACIRYSGPLLLTFLSPEGGKEMLGVLVVLLTFGNTVDGAFTVVSRSLFPYLIKWNTEGKQKRGERCLGATIFLILGAYGVLAVISLWGGGDIIGTVFGPAYLKAIKYLPAVFLVFATFSIYTIGKVALYAIKRPGAFLMINIFGLMIFSLSLVVGQYLLVDVDPIYLILLAITLANLINIGVSFGVYRVGSKELVESDFSEALVLQ